MGARPFFGWRRYWDYSGGIATDLFVHRLARIVRACGLTTPSRVVATGGQYYFNGGRGGSGYLQRAAGVSRRHQRPARFIASQPDADPPCDSRQQGHDRVQPGRFHSGTGEALQGRSEAAHAQEVRRRRHGHCTTTTCTTRFEAGEALKCDVEFAFNVSMACQMTVESFRRKKSLGWDRRRKKLVKT